MNERPLAMEVYKAPRVRLWDRAVSIFHKLAIKRLLEKISIKNNYLHLSCHLPQHD